jgi:hypothetical protein
VKEKRESEIASLERNIAKGASQFIIENCCCHDLLDQKLWCSIEYALEADEKANVAMSVSLSGIARFVAMGRLEFKSCLTCRRADIGRARMMNPKAWEAITRMTANMKAAIERPNKLPTVSREQAPTRGNRVIR